MFALDPLIHQLTRFTVLSNVKNYDWMEFALLHDVTGFSDSLLSKQLSILEKEKILEIKKAFVNNRPKTWVRFTKEGRGRYARHVSALQALMK